MKQIAKKSLALLLAVCFMLTTAIVALPLSVSAAEATKCATWADVVAAVEADSAASIKLTNHVTANSTIASFAGTFDGNGYTVTVEKTMFTALADGAVLKNFQTTAAAAIAAAPIAVTASGTVTFTNVINNVSVAGATSQMGGFLTTTAGTTTVNMTSCVNNGDIQTNNQASGIIGNTEGTLTVNFTDVVNNGDITGNKNYAGGIVCSNGALNGTMNRVINNGAIYVESKVSGQSGSDAAGLVGTAKGQVGLTLTECVNTGAVTLVTGNTSAHYGVAGFAIRTDNTSSVFTFDKCVNTGVLTSATAPANDAIAVPLKSGAAVATNCTYSSGTSTIAGATKVDAATAQASIDAIKAKMTLPTFDANKAPETDAPAGDTPDLTERFSFSVDAGFGAVTVEGPKYMTVGTTDAITVTFSSTAGLTAMAAGFNSEKTNVVDFPGEVTFESELAFTDGTDETYAKRGYAGFSTSGDPVNSAVITIPVSANAVGTSAITLIVDGTYDLFFCDPLGDEEYTHNVADIGYTITVVEENDTPDEPVVEDNSTTLDATTGSLTVSGPATAVAGESFDVTFTWSDYGFTPDAIDLNFFLNTITSKTQSGNIAVSAIKSTNLTSYATSFVGITDVENLYKIALTDMVVAEDTVEIVVTFTATTPGFTGFSLQYAALSNVGTGYTEINHIEGDPAEAYVIEITVPETSHTVIFKDGDTTLETATGVAYGATLTDVYTAPAKEGYTFKGWTDASGNAVTTVTGDITVYADYAVNEYTVNITVVNGSASNATQKLNYAGSIDATVNAALAAAGLKPATGYKDSYTVSEPATSGTTIAVTVTYSSKLTYTVKFVGFNGANLGSVTVEHGAAATAPSAPAVEGYTFTGWDKDFSKVTGALTVNAVYEINTYTVKFVGFNNADLGTVTVNHGDAAAAPTAPAVEGYTFKNWDKAFDKVTGNLTVTAVYEINKYTVNFIGKDGSTIKSETVEHGKAATAPSAPAVTGYTFKGWDKDFSKVTGNLDVTAKYEINSYNVTVTVKAEGDYDKATVNHGDFYTLPSADDIADLLTTDDIFAGWSINGKTYTAGEKIEITADTVITAILSNVQYFNVTIKDVTETIKAYAEGSTITVPAPAGKTGYTFINWTDASGKVYTAGQTITVTADITLTANYQINTYTVKFVGFNGADLGTVTVNYGAAATAPSIPTVEGYTFKNWDKDFSNVTDNLTVNAVYEINSYDIVITDHDGTVKTVKANYGANVLEVVNANYVKDASLVFVGFYNHNGTLISSTGKVTAKTLVYVAYTVEDIYAGGNANIVIGDGIITYYAGADVDAFTYGTVAKNGGTGDTITFTAPLLVDDAVASKISYAGETATYTIIVMGDVDGDADVDLTDAELAAACIGNSKALSGNYYTAANTTAPAALITARDIAAIKAFARADIDHFTNPYVL